MRKVLLLGLVMAVSVVARGEMTLVDNGWDDYTVGTAHDQGDDGMGSPRWGVQRNSSVIGDPGWVNVVALEEDATNLGVQLTNRDTGGEIDTIYACISLGTLTIYGEGTVYVRFKADGPNDTLLATNDLWPHWDYYGDETGDSGAPSFQKTTNYSEMGVIARLSGGEDFRARDGSAANPSATGVNGYKNVAMGQPVDAWQELWIQVDQANDREKFYLCEDGGTPVVVPNPDGGEWWAMRNEARDNNAVACVKFFIGMYPWPAADTETNVVIESLAVDTEAMTLDHYAGWAVMPEISTLQADLDGDGDVDLDDFVILKTSFGVDAGGDCDGDGDTDLDDFVILKNEFGQTA